MSGLKKHHKVPVRTSSNVTPVKSQSVAGQAGNPAWGVLARVPLQPVSAGQYHTVVSLPLVSPKLSKQQTPKVSRVRSCISRKRSLKPQVWQRPSLLQTWQTPNIFTGFSFPLVWRLPCSFPFSALSWVRRFFKHILMNAYTSPGAISSVTVCITQKGFLNQRLTWSTSTETMYCILLFNCLEEHLYILMSVCKLCI